MTDTVLLPSGTWQRTEQGGWERIGYPPEPPVRPPEIPAGLGLSSTVPAPVATTGATGAGTTAARDDHVHAGLTQAAADALFLTSAEADALFLTPAEADTAYVTVGGDAMTGPLTALSTFTPQVMSHVNDTGWRNVSSLLVNGWAGVVYLRRVGNRVTFLPEPLTPAGLTSATFITVPAGFTWSGTICAPRFLLHTAAATPVLRRSSFSSTNVLSVPNATTGDANLYGLIEWLTTDAWPTSLPGTASP